MHTAAHAHGSRALAWKRARPDTTGWVMNMGWWYDAMVSVLDALLFRGRLKGLLRDAVELAELQRGDRVLDIGCGTGTLALLASERVGADGRVAGVDPGPKQIARARAKAARAGKRIDFQVGVAERLPFPDGSFDVVLSTMMLHHLPDDVKRTALAEAARVLAPGGRLVVVDFKRAARGGHRKDLGAGALGVQDLPTLLEPAGFERLEQGDLSLPRIPGVHGVGFVLGSRVAAVAAHG